MWCFKVALWHNIKKVSDRTLESFSHLIKEEKTRETFIWLRKRKPCQRIQISGLELRTKFPSIRHGSVPSSLLHQLLVWMQLLAITRKWAGSVCRRADRLSYALPGPAPFRWVSGLTLEPKWTELLLYNCLLSCSLLSIEQAGAQPTPLNAFRLAFTGQTI